jgi:hypothetical protein
MDGEKKVKEEIKKDTIERGALTHNRNFDDKGTIRVSTTMVSLVRIIFASKIAWILSPAV